MTTIDAFGQMRLDGGEMARARLIELSPTEFAAFPEAEPTVPILISLVAPYTVKGRNLTAELIGGGTLEFKRASCGCQTPSTLRGSRRQFIDLIPASAEA